MPHGPLGLGGTKNGGVEYPVLSRPMSHRKSGRYFVARNDEVGQAVCPKTEADFLELEKNLQEKMFKGQRYVVVDTTERRTSKNRVVVVERLRSHCAQCGAEFEFDRCANGSPYFNRRCSEHKRPGRRVK